jgi:hypothetical protein
MYVVESYSILLAIMQAKKKLTRQGMPLFFLPHNFFVEKHGEIYVRTKSLQHKQWAWQDLAHTKSCQARVCNFHGERNKI